MAWKDASPENGNGSGNNDKDDDGIGNNGKDYDDKHNGEGEHKGEGLTGVTGVTGVPSCNTELDAHSNAHSDAHLDAETALPTAAVFATPMSTTPCARLPPATLFDETLAHHAQYARHAQYAQYAQPQPPQQQHQHQQQKHEAPLITTESIDQSAAQNVSQSVLQEHYVSKEASNQCAWEQAGAHPALEKDAATGRFKVRGCLLEKQNVEYFSIQGLEYWYSTGGHNLVTGFSCRSYFRSRLFTALVYLRAQLREMNERPERMRSQQRMPERMQQRMQESTQPWARTQIRESGVRAVPMVPVAPVVPMVPVVRSPRPSFSPSEKSSSGSSSSSSTSSSSSSTSSSSSSSSSSTSSSSSSTSSSSSVAQKSTCSQIAHQITNHALRGSDVLCSGVGTGSCAHKQSGFTPSAPSTPSTPLSVVRSALSSVRASVPLRPWRAFARTTAGASTTVATSATSLGAGSTQLQPLHPTRWPREPARTPFVPFVSFARTEHVSDDERFATSGHTSGWNWAECAMQPGALCGKQHAGAADVHGRWPRRVVLPDGDVPSDVHSSRLPTSRLPTSDVHSSRLPTSRLPTSDVHIISRLPSSRTDDRRRRRRKQA